MLALVKEMVPENFNTALIIVGGGIVTQIVTALLAWLQSRKNHSTLEAVKGKVQEVKQVQVDVQHDLNSRLTELIESAKSKAHAEGVLVGIAMQKLADKEPPPK